MKNKPVRIFLDSNVVLSGLLSDRSAPRVILDIACLKIPFIEMMTGEYNIVEIERNLERKLPQALPVYKEYVGKLNLEIVPLPKKDAVEQATRHINAKDAPVVASALAGRADFLVTGDNKDFLKLKKIKKYSFEVVSPTDLLEKLSQELGKED